MHHHFSPNILRYQKSHDNANLMWHFGLGLYHALPHPVALLKEKVSPPVRSHGNVNRVPLKAGVRIARNQ